MRTSPICPDRHHDRQVRLLRDISLCYDTGDSPAGELYLNVSFDEQFVPSPKVGYDTFNTGRLPYGIKMNFREVTPEDTEILRMIALRNGKAEDYLCCDVTNEDGVTQTTWYSKADVALWGRIISGRTPQ